MQYKYFLKGRSGTRQVFPANDGSLEKTYEKKSNRSDFTRSMKGTIVLLGNDFKWVYEQELLIYRFDPLEIIIHKYCEGRWNEEWFSGLISLNSGEWDLDNCRVELSIDNSDKYECYEAEKDTVLNLLNSVYPKVSVNGVEGTIETVHFSAQETTGGGWNSFPGEDDPYSKGWVTVEYHYTSYSNENGGMSMLAANNNYGNHEITWAREVINGNDSLLDQGWVEVEPGKYARTPIIYDRQNDPYDRYRPNSWGYTYKVLDRAIDNGMELKNIFEQFIATGCNGMTLSSDFFQWNPENPSNTSYVTGKFNRFMNLIVFQKSDVKRPFDTGNASKAELNFSDLLEDICNIFQLEWEITDDNKFKIEHVSYKSRNKGLDTTVGENAKLNKAKRKYKYDNEGIPKKEVFAFMDDNSYGDFQASPILYTNPIAGKEKDEDNYSIKNFTTDVMLCLSNSSSESKVVSDDGFVLMACSAGNGIFREASIKGGNTLNNPLAWAQLHRDLWRHNRYMLNFKMNEQNTLALSVKPIKVQEKIKYRLCCDSDFDTEGLITTALGDNGILDSATFNLFNETIELKIAFPAEGKLEDNNPPSAIDDEAETFVNTPVVIDVLANDIDNDGVIIPSSLNITSVYPGKAEITDDYKVKYTPESGFVGEGRIWYNVKDNFGEQSNTAVVKIIIKEGTSLPVANGNSFVIAKNLELRPGPGSIQKNDTAATEITVIPENKSTTEGGTVVIESNGDFIYKPKTDFIGEDSFDYRIKDTYLNEASGTINITVFQNQIIYVSLNRDSEWEQPIYERCGGSSGLTYVGDEIRSRITLSLWSDSNATVPFPDATGYNLKVKIRQTMQDFVYPSGGYNYTYSVNFTEGNEYILFADYVTRRNYYGCSGSRQESWEITFSIEPDSTYIII